MNKQQLAAKIWESANKMRSKIDASDYKDYILGFMFYKFLSEKQEIFLKENDWEQEDIKALNEENVQDVKFIQKNIGYFISYENLFSTWLSIGNQFEISNVTTALSAFDRLINSNIHHKKLFNNIFGTLQAGLSKLGDSAIAQSKAVRDLIHLIKLIPMDSKQDYDVLGFIYEYLISNFAVSAGKKAGEFYTPHEVSLLMSEIVAEHLKDKKEIKIYDPTSGSGSLLINIGKSVAKRLNSSRGIKYYAQELSKVTYDLTRMNLIMRGISADNIVARNADTLAEDWPYFDETDPIGTYDPLYVDAVVSNPPYSAKWDRSGKETDPRYKDYGLAPKSKADYAFLLHDLYHVKPKGIMTIVLPHGVLFRGNEEAEIRKNLIEKNQIDTIIGLPANIFFGTGIPTIIMVLKKEKLDTEVLFVDASKYFVKFGNKNKLTASDIKRIVDTVLSRKTTEKFSRVVPIEEIRNNEYNLNIPRYVDSASEPENWDIYALMHGGIPNYEINSLHKYWNVFPGLKKTLFTPVNDSYSAIVSDGLKELIYDHEEVKNFIDLFKNKFINFARYLKQELIDNISTVHVASKEEELSANIFDRVSGVPLIDEYKAYQLLNNEWLKIAIDLEILQTEGMKALNAIDPRMVIKKKDGKEEEVQDGWEGKILPFSLIQEQLLVNDLGILKKNESRLAEITSWYQDTLDSLSEEDKEGDYISEEKTKFLAAGIKKYIKENIIKGEEYNEDSLEFILLKANDYFEEEKELKRKIKAQNNKIVEKSIKIIQELSLEQALRLLEFKWITPLIEQIYNLPKEVLGDFIAKLNNLSKKYEDTFEDVVNEISYVEDDLSQMLNDLVGEEYDMKGIEELKKLLSND